MQLSRDSGWLQGDGFVAPAGHQLIFSFVGVSSVLGGEGANSPGFFVTSDVARTSLKSAPCEAQVTEDFIIAKPVKGYNVSIWTHYLWEDLVSIQLLKIDADRVV